MTEQQASGGPSVKQPGGPTPEWWRVAAPDQREAWLRLDRELAEELGTARPYVNGPWVGTCPGSEGPRHGLSASSTHAGGCCSQWGHARTEAIEAGRAEVTEIDRLMATDPAAGRVAIAKQKLDLARSADAYPQQIEQLEMRVRAAEAGARLDTGSRGERYMDTQAPVAGWAPPTRDLEAGS